VPLEPPGPGAPTGRRGHSGSPMLRTRWRLPRGWRTNPAR